MNSKLNGRGVNHVDAHLSHEHDFSHVLAGSRRKIGPSDRQIAQTLVVQPKIEDVKNNLGNPALSKYQQVREIPRLVGRQRKAVRGVCGTEGAPV